MKTKIDHDKEIGKRYGRLVIQKVIKEKSKNVMTECICDCGNKKKVQLSNLRSGRIKSCGCLNNENKHRTDNKGTHHLSNTQIYHIYSGMKMRCYYEKNDSYGRYGARGIKICDEWLGKDGFINFYKWSMENGYKEEKSKTGRNLYSIDRIDNNKDYSPNNCRWVLIKVQNYNKRTNFFTLEEITKIENAGFTGEVIKSRIKKYGYTLDEAIKIPLHTYRMSEKYRPKTLTSTKTGV
jgi:hypothetical protein